MGTRPLFELAVVGSDEAAQVIRRRTTKELRIQVNKGGVTGVLHPVANVSLAVELALRPLVHPRPENTALRADGD